MLRSLSRAQCATRNTNSMTPLDNGTKRQHLKEELPPGRRHQPVHARRPSPTKSAQRDTLLDRLRARWTNALDCLTRHMNPARGGDPHCRGPVRDRARHAADRFAGPTGAGAPRTAGVGAAETALRAAVERAERALSDDEPSYSVSRTHDAALDMVQAARALLNELETRQTK